MLLHPHFHAWHSLNSSYPGPHSAHSKHKNTSLWLIIRLKLCAHSVSIEIYYSFIISPVPLFYSVSVCRSSQDSSAQTTSNTRFPQCLMAPITFAFDQGITDLIKYLLFVLCSFRWYYCCCPQKITRRAFDIIHTRTHTPTAAHTQSCQKPKTNITIKGCVAQTHFVY